MLAQALPVDEVPKKTCTLFFPQIWRLHPPTGPYSSSRSGKLPRSSGPPLSTEFLFPSFSQGSFLLPPLPPLRLIYFLLREIPDDLITRLSRNSPRERRRLLAYRPESFLCICGHPSTEEDTWSKLERSGGPFFITRRGQLPLVK